MLTFSKIVFFFSQLYIAMASFFFITGYVLKDPMQNYFYLMYALTLPIVSVVLFILCCYIAMIRKSLELGIINTINLIVLFLLFLFKMIIRWKNTLMNIIDYSYGFIFSRMLCIAINGQSLPSFPSNIIVISLRRRSANSLCTNALSKTSRFSVRFSMGGVKHLPLLKTILMFIPSSGCFEKNEKISQLNTIS